MQDFKVGGASVAGSYLPFVTSYRAGVEKPEVSAVMRAFIKTLTVVCVHCAQLQCVT